ncbi:hypothetical protein P7C71_g3420, partial [Lecanoromycetidae sp. Uapishka_2]
MAAKVARTALSGTHTAGIFADMTVDGPEIGTLVAIVDRAKNLPNRKAMGKQDPYCAARLGKEAKKTETDKRGGQTPKWDQELRFTVHDSPDYYQLKISVFNDDKKTELIGETWVALDQIIMPGGGSKDAWHNLNCKGRYAGELRMELTYYDTRPREEKPEERRQSAPINGTIGQSNGHVAGPRQPKPVKRRPLPADPTGSPHSTPLPQTPPSNLPQLPSSQQRQVESPDDYGFDATPPPTTRQHHHLRDSQQRASPLANNIQYHEPYDTSPAMAPQAHQSAPFHLVDAHDQVDYRQDPDPLISRSPQHGQIYNPPFDYDTGYVDASQPMSLSQFPQNHPGMTHSNSSPAIIDARPRQQIQPAQHYSPSSSAKSHSYDESPTHHYANNDDYGDWPNTNEDAIDGIEAPPPPAHGNTGSRASLQPQGHSQQDSYAPIPATAPLNIRNGRGSIPASPLSQVQSNPLPSYPSLSPSTSRSYQPYSNPVNSVPSRTTHSQTRDARSQSPMRDYGQSMPPSLVPGYEASIAEDESDRIMHEQHMSTRHRYSEPPVPQYQQMPMPTVQSRPQPIPRNVQDVHERRAHRSSAPIIPQEVSPNPRTPMRKSISPAPGSAPVERPRSEIPFSPDSFDAYNPSLNAAASVNDLGARYNTPEQATEASRQHERQEKLGDGPIIGSDGRVIDPSDHLPTNTWAPEPEQKPIRKGPEVTIRFRQSPRGAQPLPPPTRPLLNEVRPQAVSTPIYAHGRDNTPPASAGRARLQKRSPAVTGQPVSSPVVPTLNTTPRSSPLRTPASDYPLREHENYGGYNSSPTYARGSPGNIPPPIPSKVPIGAPQEDWGMNALSEEMKRIDIGVGGGQRGARRSRYGL